MQFETTYLDRPVIVEYSAATDLHEDLDGVIIYYTDTLEQIDYDNLSDGEWFRLWEEVRTEAFGYFFDSPFYKG